MSKLKCECGHIIVDQTNDLSYKADFMPDTNREAFFEAIVKSVRSLNEAKEKGNRDGWIKANFIVPPYPTDLPDEEMIWDLIHNSLIENTRTMYQCENCGRILIQYFKENKFLSFKPEDENWKNILNKKEIKLPPTKE